MDFVYQNTKAGFGFGNDILFNILHNRGVKDVNLFLHLNDSVIEDYNLYDNITEGAKLYLQHINNESKIGWLIDFDGDGFTSTSESVNFTEDVCRYLHKNCKLEYVAHDHKSHGLDDEDALDKLLNGGYDLVIIPDAGSNDLYQLMEFRKRKIDVIILDHHNATKLSYAFATVINNQISEKVTNKAMTGVGVVYKFNKCVDAMLKTNFADKYLDLVSIGMISDSADLKNLEARYLVLKGLESIQNGTNKCKVLNSIFKDKAFSMKNKATINNVAFYMCPSINCIIRGGTSEERNILFKSLIGDSGIYQDKIRGRGIVDMPIEDYVIRMYGRLKRKQDKHVKQGVEELSEQIEQYKLNSQEIMIINADSIEDNTYNRVIVNKLADKYKRHAILLSKFEDEEDLYGGSATGCVNKTITDFRKWCIDTGLFKLAEGSVRA